MEGDKKEFEVPVVEDFSQQLIGTAKEMKTLANAYWEARRTYADCLNKISVMIYKAGLQNKSASFENKIPMLFANPNYSDEAIALACKLREAQQEYKGLELVINAYQAEISGIQSIIKFMLQGEIVEATKNKYQSY